MVAAFPRHSGCIHTALVVKLHARHMLALINSRQSRMTMDVEAPMTIAVFQKRQTQLRVMQYKKAINDVRYGRHIDEQSNILD